MCIRDRPEAILIGDHGLSCLLAEKLSLRDLRLLQQYRHIADIPRLQSRVRFWKQSGHWRTVLISLNFSVRVSALDAATRDNPSPALRRTHGTEHYPRRRAAQRHAHASSAPSIVASTSMNGAYSVRHAGRTCADAGKSAPRQNAAYPRHAPLAWRDRNCFT